MGIDVRAISVFSLLIVAIVAMSNFAQAMRPPPLDKSSHCTISYFDSNSGDITYSDMKHLCRVLKSMKGWNDTYWCKGNVNSSTCYNAQSSIYHALKYGFDTRGPYACLYNDIYGSYSCWNPDDHILLARFVVEASASHHHHHHRSPSPTMPLPTAPPQGSP